MLDEEYEDITYFKENGFYEKECSKCGKTYWTRDSERETCGDPPCDHYTFIGKPIFTKPMDLAEMREYFLNFFEQRGHTRIDRYPVVARWRDDIYLTIASIADFQPNVTSGLVPPPANPLTISQPCIRLNDLDSVGRTGRHLTTFEMMAHHVFNSKGKEIYWKDKTIELCDELLTELGADAAEVTYIKSPWAGGGNAGASVEVMVGGLELATLVFMNLKESKNGTIDVKGKMYEKMDNYIVDTGYGLERFVWASQGTPTIYDAVFPTIVQQLTNLAGIDHELNDPKYAQIFANNAQFAGIMDVSGSANLAELRKQVADSIGMDVDELSRIMDPMEKIFAIADHTRCLTFMLGDGIIPSNVKSGYLARLVIRRTIRMLTDLGVDVPLSEIVALHIDNMPEYPEFEDNFKVTEEILALEEEKYRQTIERGRKIIQKEAVRYQEKGEKLPLEKLMEIYDSHGIPPEISKEAAKEVGVDVEFPDNFYSLVADMHSESGDKDEAASGFKYTEKLERLPLTKRFYYDEPERMEFEAVVLDAFDDYVVLDNTYFYPEGGGQEADRGMLMAGTFVYDVIDVQMYNGIVVHKLNMVDKELLINRGDMVIGQVDKKRRMAHSRHHTATHIINDAARKVLGNHIWQAGAQKTESRARLDISHYKHITQEELNEIEMIANKTVMENKKVQFENMDRTEAEQKYGFGLYQGGIPPGKVLRIVKVGSDIEACGGTHCLSTGVVGPIKILKTERIQDGVERLEYAAGEAAVAAMQETESLLRDSSEILSIQPEILPVTVERFFEEWKELQKENEKLKEELAGARTIKMMQDAEKIDDFSIVVSVTKGDGIDSLRMAAVEILKNENAVAILLSESDGVKAVAAAGKNAIAKGIKAGDLVKIMSQAVGGGGGGKPDLAMGGGPDASGIEKAKTEALSKIKETLSS
ncbi:Alanine--tRNA ligase [Methanimicrococcus sp. At1]|uniref:Alanine--tRNA ligase n=1 Tax=Methanimicrococcus hacksteinii TaxID=3028293 RepID=A0ABU3VP34_9EURY|nr:alanine--tRNA ligase [Methanimicrococcus sp. At1]MDV0445059.1 Alanine--tRNA ligase [Methanimicrococcus sp. At1]